MITIPASFQAKIDAGTTTFARILTIERLDGVIFYFTDHQKNITRDSQVYKSKPGFDASALEFNRDLVTDNMEIEGILDDDEISEEEIKAGLFEYALLTISLIDYTNPEGDVMILKSARLGDYGVIPGETFVFELRGKSGMLEGRFGRIYSATCNVARLGDARCKVNLASYTFTSTVTSVSNKRLFTHTSNVQADDYFNNGTLVWNAGAANVGQEGVIKDYGSGQFLMHLEFAKTPVVGDSFTAIRGCDRTFTTCKNVFSNGVNFRGFPHLPGIDELLKVAGS